MSSTIQWTRLVCWVFVFSTIVLIPSALLAEGINQEQGKAILEELKAIKKDLLEIMQKGLK